MTIKRTVDDTQGRNSPEMNTVSIGPVDIAAILPAICEEMDLVITLKKQGE